MQLRKEAAEGLCALGSEVLTFKWPDQGEEGAVEILTKRLTNEPVLVGFKLVSNRLEAGFMPAWSIFPFIERLCVDFNLD